MTSVTPDQSSLVQKLMPGMNRNIALLLASLAFSQSTLVMLIATSTLAGIYITDDKALAFWPTALQFTGMMVTTVPAAYMMKAWGRRWGLSLAALVGLIAACLSVVAIMQGNFALLCLAGFMFGFHSVGINQMRFAAVEAADPGQQANAVSYVMAGGVVAAILGPNLATLSTDWLSPISFAGVYLAIAGLMVIALLILQLTNIPAPPPSHPDAKPRSVWQLVSQTRFWVAMLAAMLGYAVMNFMMVPTPLAMSACGFTPSDSNLVIMMHVLGMFGPSFFTGRLIKAYSVERIIIAGAVMLLAAALVSLTGLGFGHFSVALILLGVGWNFCFIGGTTMLASAYRPEERAKAQAINDLAVFGLVALSSFTAGKVLEAFGWHWVAYIVLPAGFIIALAMFFTRHSRKNSAVHASKA